MTTDASKAPAPAPSPARHFIHDLIDADIKANRWGLGTDLATREGICIHTRFPPEPNGYLHVGHAKSICLNFAIAQAYKGKFNLRFDDTNPSKEDQEYVDAIKDDVRWLLSAFNAGDYETGPHAGGIFWASDYFQFMFDRAVELVKKGKAYVCQLTGDEVSKRRGTPSVPATSPFRDRSITESLTLLEEMRAGKHQNGAMTLRAKIDLASPNFNLRDPVLYRIVHESHHNTGSTWCIYPMYDWAHGFEDSLEKITHSICTLEFENHRPLYDWFIAAVNEGRTDDGSGPYGKKIHHPQQIEFAKLRPTYTVLSKRNLLRMVQDATVRGWDDPRMPTIRGLRRRGYTPESLRTFVESVGVTKVESSIDVGRMENALREHLNKAAPRAMGVLNPLKVVIENWPEGKVDNLDFVINPEDPAAGKRTVPFTREIYIERDDFMEVPTPKFHRLAPGAEVRLRWAYFLTCTSVIKNAAGEITELRATIDPATRGGDSPTGPDGQPTKKVKGTIHWVSAQHSFPAEVRLFDRLFTAEEPGLRTGNWLDDLNPKSLTTVTARLEAALKDAPIGQRYQLERLGYFIVDQDTKPGAMVLNRIVTLKDDLAAAAKGEKKPANIRMYSLAEAAHELKIKQDKLLAVITHGGPSDFATREKKELTLDEVRKLKEWVKANPLPR
ncbi:MAG: glutamine--tRNA ligase/YqeY domain fusion protein [Phycisphaerales bacterium]|nr:glutamine--tRNA ligase/YqeY domain fusion protein [Phycisphaerales bacterium]